MSAYPFSSIASDAIAKRFHGASRTEAHRLDVLIVDDDPSTLSGMSTAVRAFGHECRVALDGETAWSLLQQRRADVVISDWQMPGMNGQQLCRLARGMNDDGGRYTYFILVTGHYDRDRLLEGMAAGADDFQRKPIDIDELEARLVSASRVVALHRRLADQARELRCDSRNLFLASRTDALTGLGNRLRMDEELAAVLARADRYGHRFCLAICDVDHFKRFNDTFGHLAGDEALRRVADALRHGLRAGDSLYRYGGEEFVLLLPEQSLSEGTLALERVRAAVERLAIPAGRGVLTISSGIAELDRNVDRDVASWLSRADSALYRAKGYGRNRVESERPSGA